MAHTHAQPFVIMMLVIVELLKMLYMCHFNMLLVNDIDGTKSETVISFAKGFRLHLYRMQIAQYCQTQFIQIDMDAIRKYHGKYLNV